MDKTTTAIRRSGARARGWLAGEGGGASLRLAAHELGRCATWHERAAAGVSRAACDLHCWSVQCEQPDAVQLAVRLLCRVADSQRDWVLRHHVTPLRAARRQLATVRRGGRAVAARRHDLAVARRRQLHVEQQLRHCSSPSRHHCLQQQVQQAQRELHLAQCQLEESYCEERAGRLVRLKSMLAAICEAECDVAWRSGLVFEALHRVVQHMPDSLADHHNNNDNNNINNEPDYLPSPEMLDSVARVDQLLNSLTDNATATSPSLHNRSCPPHDLPPSYHDVMQVGHTQCDLSSPPQAQYYCHYDPANSFYSPSAPTAPLPPNNRSSPSTLSFGALNLN